MQHQLSSCFLKYRQWLCKSTDIIRLAAGLTTDLQ